MKFKVLWLILILQVACTSKPSYELLPFDLEIEPQFAKLTADLIPVTTSIDDTVYTNKKLNYQIEQLITYEKGIIVHAVTKHEKKTVVVPLPDKYIKQNVIDVSSEEFSIEIPNTTFAEGFSWLTSKLDTTDLMSQFIHKVFPDSIPTTAWEQLIHQGKDEITIVVKTNEAQEVNNLFFDVNPEKSINTLQLNQVGETFVIRRRVMDQSE